MTLNRNLWTIVVGLALAVILAGTATAAPTPNAGGNRTVNEDAATTYSGTDASGQGVTFAWDFAGTIVGGNGVSYTFNTPGAYTVMFWADDGVGGNVSDTITVTVKDITAPSANAGADQNVNEDALVTLDASSSTDNDPNFGTTGRYYWTFTDGASSISLSGKVRTYTFATPGTYSVSLLVFDNDGNFASDALTVVAKDITAPSGGATVPASANEDTLVAFSSAAITDNDPNFASARRDYWTFTDGVARNLSGTSQSYTFNTPGTFSITLTVMDATGNKLTSVFSLTIVDVTVPTGSGSIPSPSNEDAAITFSSASITDNDPNFASNRRDYWTFTDGVAQNRSGTGPSYTFNTPGTYVVTLTVMDNTGNKLTQAITVTIRDITAPIGAIVIARTITEDVSTTFDASTVTDNDPNFATTRRVYWTFTDGSAQNLTSPVATAQSTYTFFTPGSFSVTLLVMDSAGNRYTTSGTVTVIDVTAPTGFSLVGGGASVERFRSATMTGSATDNLAVAAYWWLFTDGSAFNVSGTSLSRTWNNVGTITITFYARDAAFNIASTVTSIIVGPDVTAPTVTMLAAPTTGDDQNALLYQATATDLDPACAASCNWTWQKDGVNTAFGVQSLSVLWTPGRHSISVLVRDPTGNTRNVTTSPVDIDQVVSLDTTQTGLNLTMNFNIRIINGATLTWRNSQIWNTSLVPPRTVVITVVSGRFILENTQMTSLSTTYGFRLVANGTAGAGSYIYINQSTIDGLFYDGNVPAVSRAPISVNDGTLSITDSTLRNVRLTGSASTPQAILGTNANLYMNNVTLNATVLTTMGCIRADYTGAITVLASREIVIDRLDGRCGASVFKFTAVSMTGTVNATVRNSFMRASASSSTNRAFDILLQSNTGTFNFRFANDDAANNNYGGLYALHQSMPGGVINYNITDTMFDNSVSSNGMYMAFSSSSTRFNIAMSNVSAQRASQFAYYLSFDSSGWNQGNIWLNQVYLSNSTSQSGWYFYHYNSRVTTYIDVIDSRISNNRQMGLWLNSQYGQNSVIRFNLTRTQIADNLAYGIQDQVYYASYNQSFNLVDSSIVRNNNDNFNWYHYNADSASLAMRGDLWLNLTRSCVCNSIQGRGFYFTAYYYASQNITGMWTDSAVDNNRFEGVYTYTYLQYSSISGGGITSPQSNFTLWTDRSSISHNGADGFYLYDQYLYGYLSYTCNPACGYLQYTASSKFDLHFNNSHVDGNARRGINWYSCASYCYYSATLVRVYLTENTTVNDNAASGVYFYSYYVFNYGWLAGSTTVGETASIIQLKMTNSQIMRNGLTGGDNYGVYSFFYFSYGMGPLLIDVQGSSISENGGTGIYVSHQYNYFSSQSDQLRINASNISKNGVRGVETYYYYVYQLTGGVTEWINNTTFIANQGGAYQHNNPESYGRYFTPWTILFTNNLVDQSPTTGVTRGAAYSCQGCGGYGGSEKFNFSGNRFTHIVGAAMAWGFDPPAASSSIDVDISNNYVADVEDGITFGAQGSSQVTHKWNVVDNLIERSNGNGMLLALTNDGSGAKGDLTFQRNTFHNTGGTAFTLVQSNIKLSTLLIKDCVFNTQRTGMQLAGIVGTVDNATFTGSVKEDIVLTDGILEVHNTPVDPVKLKPVGNAAAFNVWFHLAVKVVWSGTGKPVVGAVVQMADSGGGTFFVGSVSDDTGIPDRDLWSYTKSLQGVLGRTPFRIDVTYFEIEQVESIDLFQNREVTIQLRDNVLPAVVISNPEDGFGTRAFEIQVDGSVYDSQSGFVFDINDPQLPSMYVEVSSDGVNWQVAHVKSSSAFEVQFDYLFTGLTEDVHKLYIRVHDDANNYVTREIPVTIDRTDPIVTILEPALPRIITNSRVITISAETEVGALIFVNGVTPPEVLTRPDNIHAYFTMELPVFEGPNTITVAAIDSLNNQGEASVFALVDLQPPYLAVTDPEADALTNSSNITVRGQTERTNVTVMVNGLAATIDLQGNFSVNVPLALDVNQLEVIATDAAGNTQRVVRDVKVDRTAPWINVQSPVSGALINSAEVDVIGIVEPGAKLIVNDEVVSAPTGAFSRRILLTEGENAIQFVAIDPAGNTGFRTVLVTVDSINPVLTVATPTNESLVNAGNVVVSGTVQDDHPGTLSVGGADIQINTDHTFSFVATLYEGTNFITLQARDGAGNTVTKVLTVVSDTVAPYVLPEFEGTFFEGAQVKTYSASVTVLGFAEKGSELAVCAVPANAPAGSSQVCNAIPLAADGSFRTFVELRLDSLNTVNVTATDAAGNQNTRQMQVFYSSPPAAPVAQAPVGLYALYIGGLGLLAVAFGLVMMSRRRRGGSATELSSAEAMPYTLSPQGEMPPAPPMEGDLGAASPEVAAAPEIAAGDGMVSTAPEESLEAASPPEGDVPASPSRARPMRRRPAGSGEEGAEGAGLTGMGAEEEAVPGDTHQDEQKEG